MKRVLLSWSSGKDSAWTLHVLRRDPDDRDLRPAYHAQRGIRPRGHARRAPQRCLKRRPRAAGLPLWMVPLPWPCSNEIYEQRMAEVCQRAVDEGIDAVAFGDLFLDDVRAYRERQLTPTGLEPLFPLWQIPTDALAREMIAGGLRARISCVDTKKLPATFAGREFERHCCAICRPESTPAASAASSTPASTPGPCSRLRFRLRPERSSPATASSSPTC